MKTFLLIAIAAFLCAAFIHISTPSLQNVYTEKEEQKEVLDKKQFAYSCSPDFSHFNPEDSINEIPLLQGWGNYRMPVSENNDSAKIYFEQGINMYYGFHIIESLASFERAVQFDKNFAMGYWGKALAYGPNINDFGYSASPDALSAMQKAKSLAQNCTPVEQGLINAMQARYSADTMQTREYLNQQYADAMKNVYQQFTASADAAALYADALMIQHPWDLYDKYGAPKPWTPEIVSTLEALLKFRPKHPGACHYYIHAIEGSAQPEKGLWVAALPGLMPGLAHVVHMPSHIYIRSGYYKEGIAVNEKAVKSYYNYLDKYAPVAGNLPLYLLHNLHMEATCANMDGQFTQALKISNDCKKSFDSNWQDAGGFFGVLTQYVAMTPYFTLIRFGKWDDILNTDPVPESRVYAAIIWHYGRGLAYARKHDFDKAKTELQQLQRDMKNPQLLESPVAFNAGIKGAEVAEKILQGEIAEEQGNADMAVDVLKDAVDKEDNMIYDEPKDWPHPAREYLGDALLKAKKYAEAEKVYREDLKINPNNGWSLNGLAVALMQQGKNKEATETQQLAAKAFARSDIKITGSVF